MEYYIVEVDVVNELGLHVRPSTLLANCAGRYPHEILLICGDKTTNAKSSIDLLELSAGKGAKMTLKVSMNHPDYARAAESIKKMFDDGFLDCY